MAAFQYRLSHEIEAYVSVRLGRLAGCLPMFQKNGPQSDEQSSQAVDVMLEGFIALDGHVIDGPVRSLFALAQQDGAVWGGDGTQDSLHFSLKVHELLPRCVLGVALWAVPEAGAATLVGSAVMPLFSKKGRLKSSFQKLRLCMGVHPDLCWPSTTPGKVPVSERGSLGRIEQQLKQFDRFEMPRCPWLDAKVLKAIRENDASTAGSRSGEDLFVAFHLPVFPYAVLYSQPLPQLQQTVDQRGATETNDTAALFCTVYDPEVARAAVGLETNPCEFKALKLSQALGSTGVDRDAKPSKEELSVLRAVVKVPPSRPLTIHQKTQVSKFRYYLSTQNNTIIPFLKSVDWAHEQEANLAIAVMNEWSYITVDEALLMLSGSFLHQSVRSLAVQVLEQKASDDKIYEILGQLVQCARFDASSDASLADFLVDRCWRNTRLAISLHWSLIVDCDNPSTNERVGNMQSKLYAALQAKNPSSLEAVNGQVRFRAFLEQFSKEMASAPNTLKGKEDLLHAELTESGKFSELLNMRVPFAIDPSIMLTAVKPECCRVYKSARSPVRFVFRTEPTGSAGDESRTSTGQLAPSQPERPMRQLNGAPELHMLFKSGDDLRQDQFVCQLIRIMDRLLKRENLDLRLTPYWILPISPASGILEFVPSTTLQELTARSKTEGILRFLAENSPATAQQVSDMPANRLRSCVSNHAMENFIRSNAGYAIISYLLDMGDRHQENLLITPDGKLFHIDFGYVLGMRDPKQWAKVPVPLKREIITAMGGQSSEDYKNFRKLAVEAYIILRKHSSLFLTLLGCMAGSPIECFTVDSASVSLDFALSQMEDRFKVDVSDDVARTHIFTLIDQSIANMLAPMGDTAHRIAANFRA